MLISEGFQQTPYTLPPAWTSATTLRAIIRRLAPQDAYKIIDGDCQKLERRLTSDILALYDRVQEPKLVQYDQWGQRVDRLETSEGWRGLKRVAAEEGIIDIPNKRALGSYSRLHGFAKVYLFYPRCADVGCPMAMTDGAQRVFTLLGDDAMREEFIPQLCSRDPDIAITAAQWMTERPGGSDVSQTETIAHPVSHENAHENGAEYLLDGFKWFSSATDCDVSLALARTSGEGSKGLSLFAVPMRNGDGSPNGIFIHRLKNKFGTKILPTAELSIKGARGRLISRPGRGVSAISSVLNITRMHSAMSGTAALGHGLSIARAFAQVRHVGGKQGTLLSENEMHTGALAQSELVHRAVLGFAFNVILLLGKSESAPQEEQITANEALRLRLLTPVLKSFSADLCTAELAKCMEALGGQGYMVENEFGTMIAGANVERLWEGTTSTLALDVVRVISGSKGQAIDAFVQWVNSVIDSAHETLSLHNHTIQADLELLRQATKLYTPKSQSSSFTVDPRLSRLVLYHLGYLSSSVHLLEQAIWSKSNPQEVDEHPIDLHAFNSWVLAAGARGTSNELTAMLSKNAKDRKSERNLEREMVYGRSNVRLARL